MDRPQSNRSVSAERAAFLLVCAFFLAGVAGWTLVAWQVLGSAR